MDLWDVLKAILIISITVGFIIFCVVWGIIMVILSLYVAAYTVALLHILIVEPIIFDTYSLFTIPYNDILAIANMYVFYHWAIAVLYFIGLLEGMEKVFTIKITR
jgi:hypothetical protein